MGVLFDADKRREEIMDVSFDADKWQEVFGIFIRVPTDGGKFYRDAFLLPDECLWGSCIGVCITNMLLRSRKGVRSTPIYRQITCVRRMHPIKREDCCGVFLFNL